MKKQYSFRQKLYWIWMILAETKRENKICNNKIYPSSTSAKKNPSKLFYFETITSSWRFCVHSDIVSVLRPNSIQHGSDARTKSSKESGTSHAYQIDNRRKYRTKKLGTQRRKITEKNVDGSAVHNFVALNLFGATSNKG